MWSPAQPGRYTAISVLSSGDVAAVGVDASNVPTLAIWNGTTWQLQHPRAGASSVVGSSPTDIWFVSATTRVMHFDGQRFVESSSIGNGGSMSDLVITPTRQVLAMVPTGVVYRYRGQDLLTSDEPELSPGPIWARMTRTTSSALTTDM